MLSDAGTVEEIEAPQEVISEPCMDQRQTPDDFQLGPCTSHGKSPDDSHPGHCTPQGRTPGVSQYGPCTPQMAAVNTSMLKSTSRKGLPDMIKTVMTSGSCSRPRSAITQKSRPHFRKHMDFLLGEPRETVALYQQGMSTDQNKASGVFQSIQLNTQHTSVSESQERTVPDSKETVKKEDSQVKRLSVKEPLVLESTALYGSQQPSPSQNQDYLTGAQRASPARIHETFFNSDPTWNVSYLRGQRVQGNFQAIPITSVQTHSSRPATRMGEQFTYEGHMTPPSHSQAYHYSQVIPSSSCGYKMVLNLNMTIFLNHLVAISRPQAFNKQQMRHHQMSTQINHYGQLIPFHDQIVYPGQGTVPSVGECLGPQVISSLHSGDPLTPGRPPESVSVSVSVQGQPPQDHLYCKSKSYNSPKKTKFRKPNFCPYDFCSRSFSRSSPLKGHMKMPYGCDHPGCGAKFSSLHMLIQHRKMHTCQCL